jgi:DNA-binding response OmpR family regulator
MTARVPVQVLHVEDDPGMRSMVRAALLQHGGYEVRSAGDGAGAIALASQSVPDLMLLDLDLPGSMSGIDILKTLRAGEALRKVPVVFLTASRDLLTRIELLSLGAYAVIQKPFLPRYLLQAVEHALTSKEI